MENTPCLYVGYYGDEGDITSYLKGKQLNKLADQISDTGDLTGTQLGAREHAQILAALRYCQRTAVKFRETPEEAYFFGIKPLTDAEVDKLVKKLNGTEVRTHG